VPISTKPAIYAPSTTFNNLQTSPASCERYEVGNEKQLCKYCTLPLSECVDQEHWERRLKGARLPLDRAGDPRIVTRNEEGVRSRQDRIVQLDRNPDTIVSRPVALPVDPEVAGVFLAESLGIRFSKVPVTRANAAITNHEANPSPRYSTYRMGVAR
jgi:hypothetical protein